MNAKETFLFGQWQVEVHRRSFRRSISIHLYPQKPIKVVAAKSTSQKTIIDFLLSKKNWIEKSLEKLSKITDRFPEKKFKAYENFPFLGKNLALKVVITLNQKPFISLNDDYLLFHIPRDEWSANSVLKEHPTALKEIRHFYKREAVAHLSSRIQFWAEKMGLHPTQVKFREQRTRWGSCSSRKVINLNWRLIVFSHEIIDYVIVHELAHLRHMNHSASFWELVASHIENYKDHVHSLRESQFLVEFLSEK